MLPSRLFFEDMFDEVEKESKLKCDIYEENNVVNVEMDIPGFKKEDIKVEFNKGNLIVSAEKKYDEKENKKYLRRERHFYGKFHRSFYLGEVDEDKMDAEFINGVLKVSVPKKDENESKKLITIK